MDDNKKPVLLVIDSTASMRGPIIRLPKFLMRYAVENYELLNGQFGVVYFDESEHTYFSGSWDPKCRYSQWYSTPELYENLEGLAYNLITHWQSRGADTHDGGDWSENITEAIRLGFQFMRDQGFEDWITWIVTDALPHGWYEEVRSELKDRDDPKLGDHAKWDSCGCESFDPELYSRCSVLVCCHMDSESSTIELLWGELCPDRVVPFRWWEKQYDMRSPIEEEKDEEEYAYR